MANIGEPTSEQIEQWNAWVESRPPRIRSVIEQHKFAPWKLYRLGFSGHRVTIYSLGEPMNESDPVTLTVSVSGEFNFVAFERNVFGILPEDLQECDLPGPGELIGSASMPIEAVRAAMDPPGERN